MNKLYKVGIILPLIIIVVAPMMGLIANAAETIPGKPITDITGVQTLAQTILNWLYTFFFIAAAIMILVAAFQYLTAQGSEDKIKKAKNTLIYAVIAIAIALVAMGVSQIVASIIGPAATVPISQ